MKKFCARRLGRALAVAALFTTFMSHAAESRADENDVVITGTRTPEQLQRALVKTDVVSAREAERRGATNVAEALATQPGVRVDPGAYGFLGNPSAIQIQGFDLQRVLILEDGEPVVGDVGGAIDLANLSLADLDRIEIVTGPTSALYGSSAIGGVVNIITAPPRTDGPAARARLEGRSHAGVLAQGGASYRAPERDPAHPDRSRFVPWAALDGSFFRMDGIARTPGLPDLQIPETSRAMLGARAGMRLSDDVDIRIRGRWFRDSLDGLSSQLAPGLGRYKLDEPNDTDRFTLHAIDEMKLGHGVRLRLTVGRQWIDNTTASIQHGSPVGETHDRHDRMHSIEGVATIPDGARTWVFGSRGEVESFTQEMTKVESLSSGLQTTTSDEVTPQRIGRGAVYGQMSWTLWKSSSRSKSESMNSGTRDFTILPGIRAEMNSRYGGALTPRLALSYWPFTTVHLRGGLGRGFRAPSAKELGFVFDHSSLGYRVLGNDALRPEVSWGVNADATWTPDNRFSLRAGTFMNWVDDLIDIDTAHGTSRGNVVDYRYTNYGRARTFGAQLAAMATLSPRFRADISYDYLWTRDDVNDRPLGARPPHTLTASLRATLLWKLEANARFRASTDAFVDETRRSPSYETIDLRLARTFWPHGQVYVGALNVTDVHQEPGRIGDFRPPLGRVFYGGVSADFPWDPQ